MILRRPLMRLSRSTPRQSLLITRHVHRTLISAPTAGSGPLMERRSDRALPNISSPYTRWLKTIPLFLLICGASTLAIFNYQKSSSSVVNSTLYALRMNERTRDLLGDEIYFRDRFPWVWGELNQLHGRIDIQFGVKGTKGRGVVRFRSVRRTRMGPFETQEWSLQMEDGKTYQLLDEDDPTSNVPLQSEPKTRIV